MYSVQSSPVYSSAQCTGAETWAANWASLLSTKTSEGAYSHLKMFVPADLDMGAGKTAADENESKKRKRGADDADGPAGAGGDSHGGDGPGAEATRAEADIDHLLPVRSHMTLSEISSKGMDMVEETDEYQQLYAVDGDVAGAQMTAMSIKLLEMQLTSFLWDWVGFGFTGFGFMSTVHIHCAAAQPRD